VTARAQLRAAPIRRAGPGAIVAARRRSGCLADGLRERDQVVARRRRRIELALVPDEFPSPRRSQAAGMALT
jgi:hypothetical protein